MRESKLLSRSFMIVQQCIYCVIMAFCCKFAMYIHLARLSVAIPYFPQCRCTLIAQVWHFVCCWTIMKFASSSSSQVKHGWITVCTLDLSSSNYHASKGSIIYQSSCHLYMHGNKIYRQTAFACMWLCNSDLIYQVDRYCWDYIALYNKLFSSAFTCCTKSQSWM